VKFIKTLTASIGLMAIALTPLSAIATTSSTDFQVEATVDSDFGLMCSSSDAICANANINFSSAYPGLTGGDYMDEDHPLYLKATIGVNGTTIPGGDGNIYYKLAYTGESTSTPSACNNAGGTTNCFVMTSGTNTLPMQVSYRACAATYQVFTPGSGAQPINIADNANISGTGAPCEGYTNGSASPTPTDESDTNQGSLEFNIPQQTTAPSSGEYTANLTMTVCSTDACT